MAFPLKLRKTLCFLVLWRLVSVYVVQTFHVPDEYWQSLEVAHRLAFGYGYLTWEWQAKIRSYIYPFLISVLYRLLGLLRLDFTVLLVSLPRVFQAMLSGYADYRFYAMTRSKWALFSLCTNWFWYYCATRTLANSVETALTTIALSVFPWPKGRSEGSGFLWIVGLLIAVRPTAAILWMPLCFYHICSSEDIYNTLKSYLTIGVYTALYSIAIDSWCYGAFVITPWEFFKVNVLNGIGDFYGTHHLFWYFIAALPVILGLQIFIFPVAIWAAVKNSLALRQQVLMISVIAWTIAVYSLLGHKEFRFILPLLPMLIHVCTSLPLRCRITEFRRKALITLLIISNILPGLYMSLIHQRGTLDIMNVLEKELVDSNSTKNDILFLTPCHATPLYSHLHMDVPIRFLTCDPNLSRLPNYVDEADQFFANPTTWLEQNFDKGSAVPELLVIFDNLSTKIKPFLKNYRLLVKIFHTHFPQNNYGEYVMLYRRKL